MKDLTKEQIKFLHDLTWDARDTRALLQDHRISPATFKKWRQEPSFAAAMEDIFAFLEMIRDTDLQKGAAEAMRRSRHGAGGEVRYLTVNHWRQCRLLTNLARQKERDDRKAGRKRQAPGNPIHPRYAEQAQQLLDRMQQLHQRADAALAARPDAKKFGGSL
jgi:hypothetical protein